MYDNVDGNVNDTVSLRHHFVLLSLDLIGINHRFSFLSYHTLFLLCYFVWILSMRQMSSCVLKPILKKQLSGVIFQLGASQGMLNRNILMNLQYESLRFSDVCRKNIFSSKFTDS